MAIMASCFFFHSYECQKIQTKNPFDKIWFRTFESQYLLHQKRSNLQRIIKRTHIIKQNWWGKKIR
jgi:hypothetical protein